jgi:RNA recognition motif-containing protein
MLRPRLRGWLAPGWLGREGWAMRLQYFRGNVFVANLPPDLTDDELAEAFDPFGIVLSAFVARDPATGKRLRYGFVDIATERAAKLAVAAMNGAEIDGHNLDVRISEKPAAKKKPARPGFATHRGSTRPAPREGAADQEPDRTFAPNATPRRQPTFQVERRSLPRRV